MTGAGSLAGRNILLVEDEYVLARQLVRALTQEGARIIGPAPAVLPALALIADPARPSIDAAVLDVNLAGERVYPVAEMLQEAGVPFLFASGYEAGEADPRFVTIPYLVKPLTMMTLIRMLTDLFAST
jgi:DNA-binding response OmpR family regulator